MTEQVLGSDSCPPWPIPCQPSPNPDPCPWDQVGFPTPDDYYKHVSTDQLEMLKAEKIKAMNAAAKMTEAKNQADNAWLAAKADNDAEKAKYSSDEALINLKSVNKKTEIYQNYRNKLRESLPKCTALPSNKPVDIEDDERVPPEDKAICVAEFKKAMADEELDYRNKLKTLKEKKKDADNKWAKAKLIYKSSICIAKAMEEQAKSAAEIDWRKKLAVAVKQLCK